MSDANLPSFIWSVADLLRGTCKQSDYGEVNSPGLKGDLMTAIVGALEAHTAMSPQALGSGAFRAGLEDESSASHGRRIQAALPS
jgi:hypothetical protein